MDVLPLIALILLAVIGAAVGVALTLARPRESATRPAPAGRSPGLLRLSAEIPTGWEQTLLGLHRELRLPHQRDGVAYGELYLEPDSEDRLLIRSRSEIGRGFIGAAELRPGRRTTQVRYSILRLPGDDQVRERVLDLELRIVAALRRVHPDAEVQLTGSALRELDTTDQPATATRMPFSD